MRKWEKRNPMSLVQKETPLGQGETPTRIYFTITVEIHARSLNNFYRQFVDRHMNFKFMRRVREREREIRQCHDEIHDQ